MKILNVAKIAIAIPLTLLGGCATSVWDAKWGADKPHISYVSLETGTTQLDKLYVWNPNNNAAYVFQNKGANAAACVASADVAKTRNHENELKLDFGKIIDGAKLEDKLKVIDTMTKLSEKSESASFLNVAMFHICMMAGAGKITDAEANTLMGKALEAAAKVSRLTPTAAQ